MELNNEIETFHKMLVDGISTMVPRKYMEEPKDINIEQSKKYDNFIYLGNRKAYRTVTSYINWANEQDSLHFMETDPVSLDDILSDKWEVKQKKVIVSGWIAYFLANNKDIVISQICKTEQEAKNYSDNYILLKTENIYEEIIIK